MSAILRIKDYSLSLTSNHEEITILRDINLEINKGEVLGLIGKSGSGKTLLSFSIADLLHTLSHHQSGSIEFLDGDGYKNILKLSAKELTLYRRSFVSFIFQDSLSALNPSKTCGWQIDEALKLSQAKLKPETRKALVLQALADVDLNDVERMYKSYPHELSGGQLQRILIAMTIIQRPQLIIADEPTSSLDQKTEKIVLALIKRLQKKYAFSLLMISHDLDLVKSFCDRTVIMNKGSLLRESEVENFMSKRGRQKLLHTDKQSILFESQMELDNILHVSHVSHHYKKRKSLFGKSSVIPSLQDVTFSVRRSEILGLIGSSGSGKSTIAKLLTGFEYPTAGLIYFNELDLVKTWQSKNQELRRKIQIIFQNPFSSLNPKQRIGASIREVLEIKQGVRKRESKSRAILILKSVGLTELYLDRFPYQMSGGEQQRVSIARALAMQPEVLICDECVSALDTVTKYDFLDLLLQLRRDKSLTIIFISHDAAAVEYVCDRIIQIKEGRLV